MKVYTRGGDAGETSLFGGERVRKDALRVEACGSVDELNAAIGVASAQLQADDLLAWLKKVQSALFDVGAELATPEPEERGARSVEIPRIGDDDVSELEGWIDQLEGELEPLSSFVLPGGAPAAALLHHARTVCRRAERRVITLTASDCVAPVIVRYLNRLSDLLFTIARAVNGRLGAEEPKWEGRKR